MAKPRKAPTASLILNAVYTDSRFLCLSHIEQLAFLSALGQVDTFGNITADPIKLQTYIIPLHKLSVEDVEGIVTAWVEEGLAFSYERGGGNFLHLYMTANKRSEAPECPLPPGLVAKKPDKGGRNTRWRIYDEAGNECDPDGDPLDKQSPRAAPDFAFCTCNAHAHDMHVIYTKHARDILGTCDACLNRKEEKGKEENLPFPCGKGLAHAGAGETPEGSPAPQDDDADSAPDPDFSRMVERATQR